MDTQAAIIGKAIRFRRKLHRLTLKDLAAAIDMTHGFLSQVENGKTIPGSDALIKIADVFDVSADVLLGRSRPFDDKLETALAHMASLRLDSPVGFLEALASLPSNEQQVIARWVRLSALDHVMRAPKQMPQERAEKEHEA